MSRIPLGEKSSEPISGGQARCVHHRRKPLSVNQKSAQRGHVVVETVGVVPAVEGTPQLVRRRAARAAGSSARRRLLHACPVTSIDEVEGIWDRFSARFAIADTCVPLFATDSEGNVQTREIGRMPPRPVLRRSEPMESLVVQIAERLIDDYNNPGARKFDGMLYLMGWKEAGRFLPLYVGKTETVGRNDDGALSENLRGIPKSLSRMKFARWGDNYQYHIGDLSSWVLPGHEAYKKKQRKYERWAKTLFEPGSLRLRQATYFWATAWRPTDTSVWEQLGPTTLAVTEYLVIGVAGKISPKHLLNRDGIPRQLLD